MTKQTTLLNPVKKISNLIKSDSETHIWNFSSVGGVNRVNLLSGNDIKSLDQLDQKLWTALSCPVHGMEIDSKTLALIDSDGDNRIRVPEIIAAAKWITSLLKNPDDLIAENKSLPLSSINDSTDEGKALLASAKQILKNLGKPDNIEITVKETSDFAGIFANTKFNGDGIITEDSADEEELKKLIKEIISCINANNDRNGKPGINTENITDFYKQCEEYSEWYKSAEVNAGKILPFGADTAEALSAYLTVKPKIDDFFLRCQLAEYDPASAEVFNLFKSQYEAISARNLSACNDEIAMLPIAKMGSKKTLPLNEAINPSWEKALEKFKTLVINQLFSNKSHITLTEWESIPSKFDDYNQWISSKKGAAVEKLGLENIREVIKKNDKDKLLALIDQDLALKNEADNIILVDKLTRFYRDLYTLLKNYVNFNDFYSSDTDAIFQAGRLFIDQRCCDLCIKVSDMPKHNSMAGSSGICLVYCNCIARLTNESMTIVAALTDGDIDNITVGRNAIFYDRQGRDWDATIIKIIDNPISIRQAFWSPYKKFSRFLNNQVEKFASSKEKAVEASASSHAEKVTTTVDTAVKSGPAAPAAAPAQPFDIGKFVGIFAALSLALGAIGSVIMDILKGFFILRWWQMPLAILGIILAISLPSMVLAWLKLRKRNLAPVLDANGWAVNARLTINILFGRTLTHLASLPENSKVDLFDPFKKKKNPWPAIIIAVILFAAGVYLLWYYDILTKWGIM
ncbi:MAG: hypothetical protein IPH69_00980 [Bacteroidales bacterium]|nr:hypothetical protein [Bacteroidales bacterium]